MVGLHVVSSFFTVHTPSTYCAYTLCIIYTCTCTWTYTKCMKMSHIHVHVHVYACTVYIHDCTCIYMIHVTTWYGVWRHWWFNLPRPAPQYRVLRSCAIVQVLRHLALHCIALYTCVCDLGPSHLNCLGSSGGRGLV